MKRVHFESSNIEKLLGKMDRDSVEEAYFRLAFENCPVSGCACEGKTYCKNEILLFPQFVLLRVFQRNMLSTVHNY